MKNKAKKMHQQTRRQFMATVGKTAAVGSMVGPSFMMRGAAAQDDTKRPNILLIISDQLNTFTTGVAGCDVKTPNIDSIANDGTWFQGAVCAYPLCVPSRISMSVGVYPHQRDYFGNNGGGRAESVRNKFAEKNQGYPFLWQHFTDVGYECRYIGKWHIPVDSHDPEKSGIISHGKGGMQSRTDEMCEQMMNLPADQPFFYTASYDIPHQICGWARTEGSEEKKHKTPPPPAEQCPPLPENHPEPDDMPETLKAEKELGKKIAYPTANYTDEDWRQYIEAYRRFTEGLDEYVGQLLQAVEKSGKADNTIVCFVADHGDGCSAHHWNQKTALWEECIRVPLMFKIPGGPKGVVNEHPVSSGIDLMPTLMDLAGLAIPENLQGQSLADVIRGKEANLREYTVTETSVGRQQGRTVRTARYKYVNYSQGENHEQFFDLKNDQGEMNNLINEPTMADEIKRHKGMLLKWCEEFKDGYFKMET